MISKLKVVVIATGLFWGPLICVSHAQQAQTESQAVQLIGLAGLEQNTKGRLTVLNGSLRFNHAKGTADVSVASIEDAVREKTAAGYAERLERGSLAGPFGSEEAGIPSQAVDT